MQKLETLVLSLNAKKAFDSERWSILYTVSLLVKFVSNKSVIDVKGYTINPTAGMKSNGDYTVVFT